MATIYTENGEILTERLPGCGKSEEAMAAAVRIAAERAEAVILDDDDGEWLVHPDGEVEAHWDDDDDAEEEEEEEEDAS